MSNNKAAVRTVLVDEVPWDDVRTVFGTRGDPASCWCQWFKMPTTQLNAMSQDEASELLHDQVLRGPAPGVIAYLDDEPVGWCAVEPRPKYSRLLRTQVAAASSEPADDDSVWAVTCLVVRVGFRRQGIGRALLHAAVDRARAAGARLLEAYPVDTAERQGASSASLYVGTVSLFAAEGFVEVARPRSYRVLMALEL
jgi:GNAT superfamily N-acetyltransferase